MTKPTNWVCARRRLRSAWASAQSDQILRCPHEESLGPSLPIERTAKTLIRLGGCSGWSESSLGAHWFCWCCRVAAHLLNVSILIFYSLETESISNHTHLILMKFTKIKYKHLFWKHCMPFRLKNLYLLIIHFLKSLLKFFDLASESGEISYVGIQCLEIKC